jgi:uncharacterized integral membrane protein (TIGR00697 family)
MIFMKQVAENPAEKTALIVFSGILITCYLAANIMSVRLINFFGIITFDAGTLTFPITYFIGDIMTELYGFKKSKNIIFLTFFCQIIFTLFLVLGGIFSGPEYMADIDSSYKMIFTYVPRIVLASLIAFLVGELLNAFTFEKIKNKTGKKFLWVRTIGSSVFGYAVDSTIFALIAFLGTASTADLISTIVSNFIIKMIIEIAIGTPVAYGVLKMLRK